MFFIIHSLILMIWLIISSLNECNDTLPFILQDGDKQICVDSCYYRYGQYVASASNLTCVAECDKKKFIQAKQFTQNHLEQVCVDKCEDNQYLLVQQCVQKCPIFATTNRTCVEKCDQFILSNNICASNCTAEEPYAIQNDQQKYCISNCKINNLILDNDSCQMTCKSGYYTVKGDEYVCAQKCEGSQIEVKQNNGIMCAADCGRGKYVRKEKLCITECNKFFPYVIDNKYCASTCRSENKKVNGTQCIEKCQNYQYDSGSDDICVDKCELPLVIISDNNILKCLNGCGENKYYMPSKQECVDQCPINHLVDKNKHCQKNTQSFVIAICCIVGFFVIIFIGIFVYLKFKNQICNKKEKNLDVIQDENYV